MSTQPPTHDESLPTIAGFEILAELGMGGMGVVYRARELTLRREVALKMLRADWLDQPKMKERFVREAQLLATLNHPHVVQIYGVGEVQGVPYFTTELMHTSVADATRLRMPSLSQTKRWMLEAARGLAAVHDLGIVHRDIKPENLLLSRSTSVEPEHVKVADFGIASAGERFGQRLTAAGMVLGTSGYLAPELLRGEAIDPRADQYSLGVVFFELVARRPPFLHDPNNPYAHAFGQKLAPDIREFCEVDVTTAQVLARMLEPHPSMRFKDAGELVQALDAIQEITRQTPVIAIRDSRSETQPMSGHSGEAAAPMTPPPTPKSTGSAAISASPVHSAPTVVRAATATPQNVPAVASMPSHSHASATRMRPNETGRSRLWLWLMLPVLGALATLFGLAYLGSTAPPKIQGAGESMASEQAIAERSTKDAEFVAPQGSTGEAEASLEAAEASEDDEEGVTVIARASVETQDDRASHANDLLGDYTLSHGEKEWKLNIPEQHRGELRGELRGAGPNVLHFKGTVTEYGETDYSGERWYEYQVELANPGGAQLSLFIEQSEDEIEGKGVLTNGSRTRRFTIVSVD